MKRRFLIFLILMLMIIVASCTANDLDNLSVESLNNEEKVESLSNEEKIEIIANNININFPQSTEVLEMNLNASSKFKGAVIKVEQQEIEGLPAQLIEDGWHNYLKDSPYFPPMWLHLVEDTNNYTHFSIPTPREGGGINHADLLIIPDENDDYCIVYISYI